MTEGPDSALNTVRVVAVGDDLWIPEGDCRVVSGDCLDIDDMTDLEALASAHGAVLFDAYNTSWMQWCAVLLLHVGTTRSVLRIGHDRYRVVSRTSGNPFVAVTDESNGFGMVRWDSMTPGKQLPVLGRRQRLRGKRDERGHRDWKTPEWRLIPDPPQPLRDWAWIWTPAWGPLSFTLNLEARADQIAQLLVKLGPTPYVDVGGSRYVCPGRGNPPVICVHERMLQFLRSYSDAPPEVVAYDADVLAALVNGALGELTWDMQDEEYGNFVAAGENSASLADYLSPECDVDAVKTHFDNVLHGSVRDAPTATEPEAVLARPAELTDLEN